MILFSKKGNRIKLEDIIDAAKRDFDVVFFGEEHDQRKAHELELKIFKGLSEHKKRLILCLEMFEQDVQPVVENFLEDRIDEKEFLEKSRPWNNYFTDYKPLIDYAKMNRIPVIAANIPRRIANRVARQGPDILKELGKEDKEYIPSSYDINDSAYREAFYRVMEHSDHLMPGFNKEYFFTAQVLKDAAMAEAINRYVDGKSVVLMINGKFHSDFYRGIPYQLKKINNAIKMLIISFNSVKIDNYMLSGDYIIIEED